MRKLATLILSLALAMPGLVAAAVSDGEAAGTARAILGTHPMCGAEISVTENARFTTVFAPDPAWEFGISAGLWVGALVDRGGGLQPSVSTGFLGGLEFFPVSDPPAAARPGAEDPLIGGYITVMRDIYTPDWLPDHVPLGLEVVQESHVAQTQGDLSWIDVKYTVTNISDELDARGLGWVLESVYLGMLADPDVGLGEGEYWSDDLGGFRPGPLGTGDGVAPGAVRGDLAYMFDQPGGGDDTDLQVGLALRGERAHRFAIWSWQQDPVNDAQRYSRMRGNSDTEPTIDPAPTSAADYRILLSIGSLARLAPGETTGFTVSLVCGNLVPESPPPVAARTARAPDLVVPPGAHGVRLAADASVEIWSVTGRRVATVPAGSSWDLRATGSRAPAGVYFYRPADGSAPPARIVVLR